MGLFQTGCDLRKYRQDKFVTRLNYISALEDIPTDNPYAEESPIYDFGTIGGDNHFAEFQTVASVENGDAFSSLEIDRQQLLMLVHSGSRGYQLRYTPI